MTDPVARRCSALAEELDEPMIGSVDQRRRWLLVEDHSAWSEHAVRDVLGAPFDVRSKELGLRVVLVRRGGAAHGTDASRLVRLVDTESREAATRTVTSVSAIDPAEAATSAVSAWGDSVVDPLYLVCTNGRRDACCALRGRALVSALLGQHPDQTWECTHLGGHRFAANLVCLPDGIVYGRVDPSDGLRLVAEHRAGRLDPAQLRGRSAWPAAAQAAERELRLRMRLAGLDEVSLVAVDNGRVRLATSDGEVHDLAFVAERLPPRAISCRAAEPEAPIHWRLVEPSV